MKRKTKNLLVLLAAFFLLSGCTPQAGQETQPSGTATKPAVSTTAPVTEPVQMTEQTESTTTPEEPSIYKAPPEGSVPILLYTAKGEDEAVANYLTWDVKNGTFSDSVPWYKVSRDSFLDPIVDFWNGGSFVVISGVPKDCAPGIQVSRTRDQGFQIGYGSLYGLFDTEKYVWFDLEGNKKYYDPPINNVPTDIFDATLPDQAYHATLDNGNMIAAFRVYDSESMQGDIVYVTYPVGNPDAAVWKVAHLPSEYALDVDANWNGAYWDGVLYMAAFDTVLALDLETNTLKKLDAFEKIHALTPEATQFDEDGSGETIRLIGCWNGYVIADYSQNFTDGSYHYYLIALLDGEIAGMMNKAGNHFTFYNDQLQIIGTNDSYADQSIPLGIYFAKQS